MQDMATMYLVKSSVGSRETDDYKETTEMVFADKDSAEEYKNRLQDEENKQRTWADKCRECVGLDRECPLWIEPFDGMENCDNYCPYHDDVTYWVEES